MLFVCIDSKSGNYNFRCNLSGSSVEVSEARIVLFTDLNYKEYIRNNFEAYSFTSLRPQTGI